MNIERAFAPVELHDSERILIRIIGRYPQLLQEAAKQYAPSIMANYAFDLAKEYNQFYQSVRIFGEPDSEKMAFRIALSEQVARTIRMAMGVLGIGVPEKM